MAKMTDVEVEGALGAMLSVLVMLGADLGQLHTALQSMLAKWDTFERFIVPAWAKAESDGAAIAAQLRSDESEDN